MRLTDPPLCFADALLPVPWSSWSSQTSRIYSRTNSTAVGSRNFAKCVQGRWMHICTPADFCRGLFQLQETSKDAKCERFNKVLNNLGTVILVGATPMFISTTSHNFIPAALPASTHPKYACWSTTSGWETIGFHSSASAPVPPVFSMILNSAHSKLQNCLYISLHFILTFCLLDAPLRIRRKVKKIKQEWAS